MGFFRGLSLPPNTPEYRAHGKGDNCAPDFSHPDRQPQESMCPWPLVARFSIRRGVRD